MFMDNFFETNEANGSVSPPTEEKPHSIADGWVDRYAPILFLLCGRPIHFRLLGEIFWPVHFRQTSGAFRWQVRRRAACLATFDAT